MHIEKELLIRVSEGSEQAFRNLLDLYSPQLYTHLLRLTRSKEVSEELLHDIFLQIWHTREALPDIQNFSAYLFILARNYGVNALNRIIREKENRKNWLLEQQNTAAGVELIEDKSGNIIDLAVARLSPQQRKVWIMSRQLRMKYEEIASELGISKDAVNKYLQTATKNITAYIREHIDSFSWIAGLLLLKNFFGGYPFF